MKLKDKKYTHIVDTNGIQTNQVTLRADELDIPHFVNITIFVSSLNFIEIKVHDIGDTVTDKHIDIIKAFTAKLILRYHKLGNYNIVFEKLVPKYSGYNDINQEKIYVGDIISSSKDWNPSEYRVIVDDDDDDKMCFISLDWVEHPYTNPIHYVEQFKKINQNG